jgi:YidC/Oxa1 family membrane protein insertase
VSIFLTDIYLIGALPFFDAGVIIVIFTVLIKLILLPLSIKASKTQLKMKSAEKDLEEIKNQNKNSKEEQARKTMEYYKEHEINPFSGFFILLIQMPIIIGLYQVFLKSGLPTINTTLLYSFVSIPSAVNMMFLGLVDIAGKNIWLAIIAGLTTYFQISLASASSKSTNSAGNSSKTDFMQVMNTQMKYVFPVIVIFISYSISAALSLYWIGSNVFAIVQEWYIRRKYHKAISVI